MGKSDLLIALFLRTVIGKDAMNKFIREAFKTQAKSILGREITDKDMEKMEAMFQKAKGSFVQKVRAAFQPVVDELDNFWKEKKKERDKELDTVTADLKEAVENWEPNDIISLVNSAVAQGRLNWKKLGYRRPLTAQQIFDISWHIETMCVSHGDKVNESWMDSLANCINDDPRCVGFNVIPEDQLIWMIKSCINRRAYDQSHP